MAASTMREAVPDGEGAAAPAALSAIERRLLDEFQHGFPLSPRPFATIAGALGVDESTVIEALRSLSARGCIARVGAVVAPHRAGASTLAAMAVPAERLDAVAALVGAHDAVNHNYEREHRLNLWFVVAAANEAAVRQLLGEIEAETGLGVLELPLVEEYRESLKTPFADLNNIASGGLAGAITAGLFLSEFVPEKAAWAHLDIAGPMFRDKDWKYYEAGAIGFGLKTIVDLCERFHDPVA
jgi:DNA-binding Lrp family transcriptional regulator